jgi:Zn-dependent M32 family carboxypeptidase
MTLYKRINKNIGKAGRAIGLLLKPSMSMFTQASKDVSSKYPPQVAHILKECGNDIIKSVSICREVVKKNTEFLLKALSGSNTWEEAKKKNGFDNFYHLFIIVDLGSKKLHIEKNEVIRISYDVRPCEGGITMEAGKKMTLNELLEDTRKRVGDTDFFTYDPLKNNCQNFIKYLLQTLQMYNHKTSKFVYQDIKGLRESLPKYTHIIAKGLTDLGALANTAYQKTSDYIENG